MATEWYLQTDGQEYGPYTGNQLKQYAGDGRVLPTTLVKQGSAGSWLPASRVRGLFATAPSAAPAATPASPRVPPARPTPAVARPTPPAAPMAAPAPQPMSHEPNDFFSQLTPGNVQPPTPPAYGGYVSGGYGGGSTARDSSSPSTVRAKKSSSAGLKIGAGVLGILAFALSMAATRGLFSSKQSQLQSEADKVNRTLPKQIDAITRFDRMDVGPNLACTMIYTLSKDLTADEKRALQAEITRMVKTDAGVKRDLDAGCKLRFRYLNAAGKVMLEFGI